MARDVAAAQCSTTPEQQCAYVAASNSPHRVASVAALMPMELEAAAPARRMRAHDWAHEGESGEFFVCMLPHLPSDVQLHFTPCMTLAFGGATVAWKSSVAVGMSS